VKKYFGSLVLLLMILLMSNCSKKKDEAPPSDPPVTMSITRIRIDNSEVSTVGIQYNVRTNATIRIKFNKVVDRASVSSSVQLRQNGNTEAGINIGYENNDSSLVIQPVTNTKYLSRYTLTVGSTMKAVDKTNLATFYSLNWQTEIDSTNKYALISDSALLDLVQRQTFRYFWDYGHPVSGLARERSNATPETITSGGSGFGIMAIPVAINRGFISRSEGLARLQTIVAFLMNKAQKFHGAFPHWLNGTTGAVIPFSAKDDGADLVETSYLMAGLLTARQYFNGNDAPESSLRQDINTLWNNVEWSWFRKNNENVLYWHWSPGNGWGMNVKIQGWNECLITYILAAASETFPITQAVYWEGFARSGSKRNGGVYYGYSLPLGPANGGPLFWSHYSFLGIDPNGLVDAYANYQVQVNHHARINYEYCKANPKDHYGYSQLCWGLTASDIPNGYNANEPNNDIGVVTPTAALSSFPYTPVESMDALKFFYYTLGDKLWKQYGFVDAFSLKDQWYAESFLAIDQGPIIIMIENYRTGLVWKLLTSCPEVKNGLKNVLGFSAPYL
jgi:hypothetical protein